MARAAREDADRLVRCAVLFEVAELLRDSRMSFWEDDLAAEPNGASPAQQAVAAVKRGSTWRRPLPIARVPVRDAVPVLGRARHEPNVHPAAAYWGRVAHFALKLIARGRLAARRDHGRPRRVARRAVRPGRLRAAQGARRRHAGVRPHAADRP